MARQRQFRRGRTAPSGEGPGVWVPTPPASAPYLLPQWGFVVPFVMPAGTHFRPSGPPPLDSREYAADYAEVKAFGAAVGSDTHAGQDEIANFWADGAGTETPPGHWNSIAQEVAGARRQSLIENARLFALLNVAMADAAICAWDAKYAANSWRPVTAIRKGETDGNPATAPDPTWSSFIVTPPFPDYVSGHSTFSGAAARILARFYRTDRIAFTNRFGLSPRRDAPVQELLGRRRRSRDQPALRRHSLPVRQRGRVGGRHRNWRLDVQERHAAEGPSPPRWAR